jgi:hypothetical protein
LVYKNGEIAISPNTIYWVKMPVNISETNQIELLKNDVLVIDCNYGLEDFKNLVITDNTNTAYFYNLDAIIQKDKVKKENLYAYCTQVAQFIAGYLPQRSVIHTYIIDGKINEIFRSKGLIYIEKNLFSNSNAVMIVMNLIKPIFSEGNRIRRSSLRVGLYPDIKYKVEITNMEKNIVKHGVLKDISLNGIGMILLDKNDLSFFALKDNIQIKIFTPSSVLKIFSSIITRIDQEKIEVGVNYNILDNHMVKDETAHYLTKLIFYWIKDIISQHGKT